jgi:hypothetical protein
MTRGTRALPILIAIAAIAVLALPAAAFHDDGVAHCNGCHTMHNSESNATIISGGTPGIGVSAFLLKTASPTDTCLLCHDRATSYGVFGTDVLTPMRNGAGSGAGDYVFLLEDNLNEGHGGASNPILGYQAGHNVVSATKGIVEDPVNTTAPGGTFLAQDLACSSCHDPHGTGAFRLLYGANRLVNGVSGTQYTFPNEAPVAVAIANGSVETQINHTAYVSGMSAWCGNCHGDYHANDANLIHPSGTALGATIAGIYNAYNGTTDCVNNPPAGGAPCGTGTQASAYLALVPFEDDGAAITSTAGPSATSRVMCLSCHRAHATSSTNAGRWDFNVTLLAEDGEESGSYALPNPYDANQRSLCNKCHAKDEFDHIATP